MRSRNQRFVPTSGLRERHRRDERPTDVDRVPRPPSQRASRARLASTEHTVVVHGDVDTVVEDDPTRSASRRVFPLFSKIDRDLDPSFYSSEACVYVV